MKIIAKIKQLWKDVKKFSRNQNNGQKLRQNEKVNFSIFSEGGNRQKYLNFSTLVETMPQIQENVTHCYQDK